MKKIIALILFLIQFSCFAAFADLLATATTTLKLDFDAASYYEFGFSNAPVHSGSSPSPISIGTPLLKTAENGLTDGSIESETRTVYAYWNIVSSSIVELSLSMSGKLFPPNNHEYGIDWTVSKVENNTPTKILSSSENLKEYENLITISPTLGSASGSDASGRVGSIALEIKASYEGEVANMIAGTYSGNLILGVTIK